MTNFSHLYDATYFKNRNFNELKRLRSFEQESEFIKKYSDTSGAICDVGCSTGEFLSYIEWGGRKYGLEISDDAVRQAIKLGISFDKNILTEENYFDVVVFRGTIQHLPDPFLYIEKAYASLKKGGHIFFLATPNARSLVYKLFNTLPALNPKYNFYIPSDYSLKNILENFNFQVLEITYPYLKSPYANFIIDHLNFIRCLLFRKPPNFAFWGSMMNIVAEKR